MTTSYTSAEACRMLGISRRTLTNWISSGKVKPTWTAPGENGQHSWSATNLERIAARNGIELRDAGQIHPGVLLGWSLVGAGMWLCLFAAWAALT